MMMMTMVVVIDDDDEGRLYIPKWMYFRENPDGDEREDDGESQAGSVNILIMMMMAIVVMMMMTIVVMMMMTMQVNRMMVMVNLRQGVEGARVLRSVMMDTPW